MGKDLKYRFLTILAVIILLTGCKNGPVTGYSKPAADAGSKTGTLLDSSSDKQDEDAMDALEVEDTAVVISLDSEAKQIVLQNSAGSKRYELTYDGRTEFFDSFDQPIAGFQVNSGDIVNVRMSVHSGYLKSLKLSPDIFTLRNVSRYTFDLNKHMLSVGKDNYRLSDRTLLLFSGEAGEIRDICPGDILTVRGIDRTVLTCTLESGHGYLKLLGEDKFTGGWLEIADTIIRISEDMLLMVPQGEHEMRITYKGRGGTKNVTIERDKETLVDITDLEDELLQKGKVTFKLKPVDAKLYINGEETLTLLPVELEYGVYAVTVKHEDCDPYSAYISVGKPEAEIEIDITKGKEDEEDMTSSSAKVIDYSQPSPALHKDSSSAASSSSRTHTAPLLPANVDTRLPSSTVSSSSEKEEDDDDEASDVEGEEVEPDETPLLFIDEPDDVEVYYDGSYIGISPLSIKKDPGTHVITLRKDGYATKSYTITLSDEDKDESYEFRELVPAD